MRPGDCIRPATDLFQALHLANCGHCKRLIVVTETQLRRPICFACRRKRGERRRRRAESKVVEAHRYAARLAETRSRIEVIRSPALT